MLSRTGREGSAFASGIFKARAAALQYMTISSTLIALRAARADDRPNVPLCLDRLGRVINGNRRGKIFLQNTQCAEKVP